MAPSQPSGRLRVVDPAQTPRLGPRGQGPDWEPPAEFDGYQLKACIGKGAMGRVYLAQDGVLDRPVAIKFIDVLRAAWYRHERFLVEARAIARLQHPNVVVIYRIGEVKGYPYIASEYVRGDRLDEIPMPVPSERVLRIGLGLARGLAAAHRQGVVHRDIKPANVILSEGVEVKLLDFGLAKLVEGSDPSLWKQAGFPLLGSVPVPRLEPATEVVMSAPLDPVSLDQTQELRLPASPDEPDSELSREGAVVGTPGYIAPEVWEGESATFRSDVYSLGAVLYRLCTGAPPYYGRTLEELRDAALAQEVKPVAGVPGLDPRLAAIIQRCLNKSPSLRYASGEELREALEALAPERRETALPEGNPYRGLRAFEAEHRSLFFGRDAEVRAIFERLRSDPFVLVAGTSGVGKSSLCRAGVLPRIAGSGLGDDRPWSTVTFTPGKRPIQALALALAPYWGADEETLAEGIRTDWRELYRELRRRQKDRGPLLLFIDQLEELVTLADAGEAEVMAEILDGFSSSAPGLRLLATVRGDFLVRIASLPHLSEDITRALYLLKPLSAEGIREAIISPARAKGVVFESNRMVKELVDSTTEAEGALPLLQFALAELWETRDPERGIIPASALAATGGVNGALARHADGVLAAMPSEQRTAARRILLQLVTLEGTRARQTEKELGAEAPHYRAALSALVQGRLITANESPEGSAFEVAHEALIRSWPTLRRWLDEDAERRILRDRLASAISEWERLGRKREALWSARQLTEATMLEGTDLLPREKVFLEASRRAMRFRRRLWMGSVVLAILALIGAYFGIRLKAKMDLSAKIEAFVRKGSGILGEARTLSAEADRLRKEAFALFDGKQRENAEQAWSKARLTSAEVENLYVQSGHALEAALMLGNGSTLAKELLADVLYERALLAERDGRTLARDELLSRLPLYDDGSRQAKWIQPARLSVDVTNGVSHVQVQRFRERNQRNPELIDEVPTLTTPFLNRELPAGSYLLVLSASGQSTVRFPILLRRGENQKLVLRLPAESEIPHGFVYVPPGAFLFGSMTDESMRLNFYRSAPIHEIQTDAYLIAKHETTFGEWLEYLLDLPEPERTKRLPLVGSGPFNGSLSLRQKGAEWLLMLQLGTTKHVLRTGDLLVIPERTARMAQDWHRLPLVGISMADAEAYVHWLHSSGRLPGARLCTEKEWERAARGADGREYPHGNQLAVDDANFDETYGRGATAMGPDEVGSHPASRSPFGLDDASGNVWEMTRSSFAESELVVRGGSYLFSRNTAQLSNRQVVGEAFRDVTLGLRVCASVNNPLGKLPPGGD